MRKLNLLLLIYLLPTIIFCQTNFIRHYTQQPVNPGYYNMDLTDIISIDTNHFFLATSLSPYNGGCFGASSDVVLMKTTFDGEPLWTKMYDSHPWDVFKTDFFETFANNMILTSDTNFIVTSQGFTMNSGSIPFIFKINLSGDLLWSKGYDDYFNTRHILDIKETFDNGFIFTGSSEFDLNFPPPYIANVIYLVKLDSIGNLEWCKSYFGGLKGAANFVEQTNDGGFFIGGLYGNWDSFNPGASYGSPFLLKTDNNGNVEWAKAYGSFGSGVANDALLTNDGEILVTGTLADTGFLLKVDSTGLIQWSMGYDGIRPNSISSISDSTYIISGNSKNPSIDSSIIVIKVNSSGDTLFTKEYSSFNTLNVSNNMAKKTPDNGISIIGSGAPIYGGLFIKTNSEGEVGCYAKSSYIKLSQNILQDSSFSIVEHPHLIQTFNDSTINCSDTIAHGLLCYNQDCQPNNGIDFQISCDSFTWINGITYTYSNNIATDTMMNVSGCDSIVTLNLTINSVDSTVTNNSPLLISNAVGANYQWINCSNMSPIPGEINQSFYTIKNGSYAVVVTQNGCTDTSICESIINVNVSDLFSKEFSLKPNPTSDLIKLTIDGYNGPVNVEVYDFTGKILKSTKNTTISLKDYAKGIYIFRISFGDRVEEIKVVKD